MDPLRRIATAPGEWTAEQVLDALPVHLPPDAPPRGLAARLVQDFGAATVVVEIAPESQLGNATASRDANGPRCP